MTPPRLRFLGLCIGMGVLFPPFAAATNILIDFGRVDNQTTEGNFNNVYGTGTGLDTPTVELVDAEGAETGITLEVDFSAGGSWAGAQADYPGPYPDAVAGLPQTAIQDSMFIRTPARSTFTLTGLDPGATYDVLIYGARGNNGGANAEWTFTDNGGETMMAFDVFNNATEVALFEGLVPDENNELTLLFTSTDDGSRPRGAMGFMQITAGGVAPPVITGFHLEGDAFELTFTTPNPDWVHALQRTDDLKTGVWIEEANALTEIGPNTFFTRFARPVDVGQRFFRIAASPPPPLLEDDFETSAEGWLIVPGENDSGQTTWELGVPPAAIGANSGQSAFGTDLDAPYGNLADIMLQTPLIQLPAGGRVVLEFWYRMDTPLDVEGGRVLVVDRDGNPIEGGELGTAISGATAGWTPFRMALPEAALGQEVRVGFQFLSDETEGDNGQGWFIDDVLID